MDTLGFTIFGGTGTVQYLNIGVEVDVDVQEMGLDVELGEQDIDLSMNEVDVALDSAVIDVDLDSADDELNVDLQVGGNDICND